MIQNSLLNDALDLIDDEVVVLTFCDKNYIEVFNLFYKLWSKLNLKNLLVVCLDKNTYVHGKSLGLNCVLYEYNVFDVEKFWKIRLKIIDQVFKTAKKKLIHTDSDCFWFKNIIPHLIKLNCDVCFSGGTVLPQWAVQKYGFCVCFGFFYIEYSRLTEDFFDNIICLETEHDQIATNEWIFSNYSQIINSRFKHNLNVRSILFSNNMVIDVLSVDHISRWSSAPKHVIDSCFCFHPFLQGTHAKRKAEAELLLGERLV